MPSPEEGKPAAAPLDAERETLRKAGYTEAEVSQILIARASQQPAGATGQGVMSNVLSSLVAVGSYARTMIFSFRKDAATMFDGVATASARVGATASLAVKAIVVLVLGYAAWQEWQQHVMSATEIARSEAIIKRQHAEAAVEAGRPLCSAKAQAELLMTADESATAENKKALDALCDESPEPAAARIQKFLAAIRAGQPARCGSGENYVAGACRPVAQQ